MRLTWDDPDDIAEALVVRRPRGVRRSEAHLVHRTPGLRPSCVDQGRGELPATFASIVVRGGAVR